MQRCNHSTDCKENVKDLPPGDFLQRLLRKIELFKEVKIGHFKGQQ